MPRIQIRFLVALVLSLGIHAGLVVIKRASAPPALPEPLQVRILVAAPVQEKSKPVQSIQPRKTRVAVVPPQSTIPTTPIDPPADLVTPAAPPAPTAEDWALASTYTLRNSKRYRHNWGQLVRSMMGPATEGAAQGQVRFRIEIAPDGKVAKVEELWSTSEQASRLARQAIQNLPALPPTPTGEPLIFERTISFLPFETGWPPSYKLDCVPEPERFNNPYAAGRASGQRSHRPPIPEDCVIDSTAETIEQEEQEFKRQMDQWRWAR